MKSRHILLSHGSGGKASHDLIREMILPAFSNDILNKLNDQAVLNISGKKIAFTTDSFVVSPLFFPGGDIGKLAIFGTVNDLSMCGAKPLYLSVGLLIEEGLDIETVKTIISSMKTASEVAGVQVVTGDTKVINRGHIDKLFINTSGIGVIEEGIEISGDRAVPGDKVIISNSIGNHGIAVISQREGLELDLPIESDCAPLNYLVADMLSVTREIHCLRDPTRGGLATTLNELSQQSNVGILIDEAKIPIKEPVRAACELLGYDPLYVANEGVLVAIVPDKYADSLVSKMRQNVYGRDACIIGEVIDEPKSVLMKTLIGGTRVVDMLTGELLPRIC